MYESFYELTATPFSITPDPKYLYFSHRHREAFEHILFGIAQRKGFVQITGEVGAGKSTICRAVLAVLDKSPDEYATALILNPIMTGSQLLRSILREFDLDDRGNDRVRLLQRLNDFLLERASSDTCVVLILDEAQDLSDELLEEVRLLSNLETEDRKLLQIVLVGQPELRRKLDSPRLRQLRQRITVRYHLGPIGRSETEDYILHRLTVAGSRGRPTFSPAALRAIHRYSGGVPRLINTVCDKALLVGYVEGRDHLGWRQIRRGIRELEGGRR
ncbi:MAG TPA: AAA family ATPase [Thermoanaerobaculales bacterium]|nr:AAA family ATPase [Thermoanaerobaculales bacterium]HQP44762.1 AAA family ATPase [Thermoanaerobaculales bacterium]